MRDVLLHGSQAHSSSFRASCRKTRRFLLSVISYQTFVQMLPRSCARPHQPSSSALSAPARDPLPRCVGRWLLRLESISFSSDIINCNKRTRETELSELNRLQTRDFVQHSGSFALLVPSLQLYFFEQADRKHQAGYDPCKNRKH